MVFRMSYRFVLLAFVYLYCCYRTLFVYGENNNHHYPNATDKTLILSLAELAANAYLLPVLRNTTTWRNSTEMWLYEYSYGWEIDGLRGHVFRHRQQDVVVFSVKGTSLNSRRDKESANLICSCNCCFGNCTRECEREKLKESLPNMYFTLLIHAYHDAMQKYPDHSFWFTGHSMGAVIAALAGVETCNPTVGFSAPGEQLFADRIGLTHNCASKEPDRLPPIYHVGYFKDPIFMGECGWLCMVAGYRMDSICHHGYECVYADSVDDDDLLLKKPLPWALQDEQSELLGSGFIYTHTINFLIDKVIKPRTTVPTCVPVQNCIERCTDQE